MGKAKVFFVVTTHSSYIASNSVFLAINLQSNSILTEHIFKDVVNQVLDVTLIGYGGPESGRSLGMKLDGPKDSK